MGDCVDDEDYFKMKLNFIILSSSSLSILTHIEFCYICFCMTFSKNVCDTNLSPVKEKS